MIILILLLLILLGFCFYLLYRNDKVFYFLIELSSSLFNESERILNTYKDDNEFHEDKINYKYIEEKIQDLLDKNSYNKYLFSFKPLKIKNWFTEEDLEFMKYLKQYRKCVGVVK